MSVINMAEVEAIKNTVRKYLSKFDTDTLSKIENDLTRSKKISLFYLLNNDPNTSLNCLKNRIDEPIVTEWGRKCGEHPEWKLRVIESLMIMQNYLILKKLGYLKRDLTEVKTLLNQSLRNKFFDIRKVLYSTFDKLTIDELEEFIKCVNSDTNTTNSDYLPQNIEMYLLEWQVNGYYNFENIDSLVFLSKKLFKLNYQESYKFLQDFIDSHQDIETIENFEEKLNHANKCQVVETEEPDTTHAYKIIDENDIGICIIINEKNYRTADHEPRRGSEVDCIKLKETMPKMNINTFLLQDLDHFEIFPMLQRCVADNFKQNHSVLFVVIMAHGHRDVIYGVNGEPVELDKIKDVLSNSVSPCLKDIPKVIIYQTCRGDHHKERSDYETDGVSETPVYHFVKDVMEDFVMCYPTISGFRSYRHPSDGSPYIKILCEQLLKSYRTKNINTILTEVNNEFADFQFTVKIKNGSGCHSLLQTKTIPEFTSTLRKDLYLFKK